MSMTPAAARRSELTVQAKTEVRARALAEGMLARSDHHLGVEVCESGQRLFGVGSFATRTWCEQESKRRVAAR